jgi:hypothetical protein
MVVSSKLRARARRRDGVGGEHRMKHAWLPTVEVDATLAAMALMGSGGVVVFVG